MNQLNYRIQNYLQVRKEEQRYRNLFIIENKVDFSSNDYLGFSHSAYIRQQVKNELYNNPNLKSGATGSRLLSGNSALFKELEHFLAQIHHSEAALLFNSGFDANVGLISTVAKPGDVIFYDEFVHASIHQGMKLSGAELISFEHNCSNDLKLKLESHCSINTRFIITESIFSMEGDRADLKDLANISKEFNLNLIVDEAHAVGLFGRNGAGWCIECGIEHDCFARVITFGKAIGSHGAAVLGSTLLINYLINFSKNFIYTTGLETSTLLTVKHTYKYLQSNVNQLNKLSKLINYFNLLRNKNILLNSIVGEGPIFGIIIGENIKCKETANYLQENGLDIRPILSPTVKKGTERLRVILHSFNTEKQIDRLFFLLTEYQLIINK